MSKVFKFRKLSPVKAKSEITDFILREKNKGVRTLSALDVILTLRIPASQVENVFEDFEKSKKIKEING